jgi:hypothetical protein
MAHGYMLNVSAGLFLANDGQTFGCGEFHIMFLPSLLFCFLFGLQPVPDWFFKCINLLTFFTCAIALLVSVF